MAEERRVEQGQRLHGAISHRTINTMVELVRRQRLERLGAQGGGGFRDPLAPGLEVLVQNLTGASQAAGAILSVQQGTPLDPTDPEFVRRPCFAGAVPASASDVVAVLRDGAADGEVAPAVLRGLAVVALDVTDATHGHAVPVAGDASQMASATRGHPVLWTETGDAGAQLAVVLLDGGAPGPDWTWLGRAQAVIPAAGAGFPGAGPAALWMRSPATGAMLPTGAAATAYNPTDAAIGSGAWLELFRDPVSGGYWGQPFAGSCAAVTVSETDPRCEAGLLNVYERAVHLGVVNGCLTRSEGAWFFAHAAGCCACGSGSGSGSGSGAPCVGPGCGTLGCGGCCVAATITATVTGLTDGTCAGCNEVNGTYTLTYRDPHGAPDTYCYGQACCWRTELFDGGCGSPVPPSLLLHCDATSQWFLTVGFGGVGVNATLQGAWACAGPNVFVVDDASLAPYCHGPVTIALTMCAGGSGSGSGSGSGTIDACGCTGIPQTLTVTLTSVSGCSCLAPGLGGSYGLTYNRAAGYWEAWNFLCGFLVHFVLRCDAGTWKFDMSCGGGVTNTLSATSVTCPPAFAVHFGTMTVTSSCCFGGQVDVTVTI